MKCCHAIGKNEYIGNDFPKMIIQQIYLAVDMITSSTNTDLPNSSTYTQTNRTENVTFTLRWMIKLRKADKTEEQKDLSQTN